MAVDFVPQAGRELKAILKQKERFEEAKRIYEDKRRYLKFLKRNLPGDIETKATAAYVKNLKGVFDRLKKEWKKAEQKLCPHCKGAQWDPNYHGQMCRSCHSCRGVGTLKGHEAREAEMRKQLQSFVVRNTG